MERYFIPLLFPTVLFFGCADQNVEQQSSNYLLNDSNSYYQLDLGEEARIIEPNNEKDLNRYEDEGIFLSEIPVDVNQELSLELETSKYKEGLNQFIFSVNGDTVMADYGVCSIINNYTLLQSSALTYEQQLLFGNNVLIAFLTDKNKISVKNDGAGLLRNITIGRETENLFDMGAPHLFYYLPQMDAGLPILDFYLVNVRLLENDIRIKVNIDSAKFLVDKWAAYKIEGLAKGEHKIRIQLVDKNENLVEGPFNDSGVRIFTVDYESADSNHF